MGRAPGHKSNSGQHAYLNPNSGVADEHLCLPPRWFARGRRERRGDCGRRLGLRANEPPLCPASDRAEEQHSGGALRSEICDLQFEIKRSVAAAGGSAPGRQPATAHVQPRLTHDNLLLHLQHALGQRNRVAVGNVLRTMTQGSSRLATLGFGTESRWASQAARRRSKSMGMLRAHLRCPRLWGRSPSR